MTASRIAYVSLHFRNGESKSYRVNDLKGITNDLILVKDFQFIVINLTDRSLPIIIHDIQDLYSLWDEIKF